MSIVAMRCTSLTVLNLAGCKDITDGALGFAVAANPSLRELHVRIPPSSLIPHQDSRGCYLLSLDPTDNLQ